MKTPPLQLPRFHGHCLSALFAVGLFAGAATVRATVTLEVYFNNDGLPAGALAALVADVTGNGFLDLSDPSVSGTALVPGARFGGGDDRILAIVSATGGTEWVNGSGIGETVAGLDYAAHGITEGTDLALYVFPDLRSGDAFVLGDRYVVYRSADAGDSGGDIPFDAPADGGVYTLAAITAADGGGFEPSSPAPEETYETGNAGAGGDGTPDDHGNSRQTATPITGGTVIGEIAPGDLDYFEFTLDGLSLLTSQASGAAITEGWLFDGDGNLLASPGEWAGVLERILGPGTYRIALRGGGNDEAGTYSLFLSSRALPESQPDLTLGKSTARQLGNDFYSPSGAGQLHRIITKPGRRARTIFTVGNDGGYDSQLALNSTKGNRFVQAKYMKLSDGVQNVTALAVTRGFLANYSPLTSRLYQVDLTPAKGGKTVRKRSTFLLNASSGILRDRGVVSLQIRSSK
jgi:hypothetical protein